MTTDVIKLTDGNVINGHTIRYQPKEGCVKILDYATNRPKTIPIQHIAHYYTPKSETRPGQPARHRVWNGQAIGTQDYHDIHPDDVSLEEET